MLVQCDAVTKPRVPLREALNPREQRKPGKLICTPATTGRTTPWRVASWRIGCGHIDIHGRGRNAQPGEHDSDLARGRSVLDADAHPIPSLVGVREDHARDAQCLGRGLGEPPIQVRPVEVRLPHPHGCRRPAMGAEPRRQSPLSRASLGGVLEVDRRRALLVDEESSEPGHASGEGHRIVGRALLDRYARWIELVGWQGWLENIVGTATGEQNAPG